MNILDFPIKTYDLIEDDIQQNREFLDKFRRLTENKNETDEFSIFDLTEESLLKEYNGRARRSHYYNK